MRPPSTARAAARGRAASMVRRVPPSKIRSTRTGVRSGEPRAIALDDDAPQDAALAPVVVAVGSMHRGPIVDDQHVALAPDVVIDDLGPDHPLEQIAHVGAARLG